MIGRGNRTGQVAFGTPDASVGSATELDAWKCREEFLGIAENDNETLLKFLTKLGEWHRLEGDLLGHRSSEVASHHRQGNPMPVDVRALWQFRDSLKHALVDKRLPDTSDIEFPLSFELTGMATGVVTITNAYHLLLATVLVDAAKKIRFRICQREDCGKVFPLQSKHKKKFCCEYCAHITTVRRSRGKKKPGRKSGR